MRRVTHLLDFGLTGPSQRNDAFLKLAWYFRTIEGLSVHETGGELWRWVQANHHGHSREFNEDLESVRRKAYDAARFCMPGKSTNRTADSRGFFQKFLDCGLNRGVWIGNDLLVEVPSRTLKNWDREYCKTYISPMLKSGVLVKGPNYGADIGRCNAYLIPNAKALLDDCQ